MDYYQKYLKYKKKYLDLKHGGETQLSETDIILVKEIVKYWINRFYKKNSPLYSDSATFVTQNLSNLINFVSNVDNLKILFKLILEDGTLTTTKTLSGVSEPEEVFKRIADKYESHAGNKSLPLDDKILEMHMKNFPIQMTDDFIDKLVELFNQP